MTITTNALTEGGAPQDDQEQINLLAGVPDRATIGRRIYQARKAAKLSQERLGGILGGISHPSVHKIEAGSMTISIERLLAVAAATGRPLGWFLRPVGEDEPSVPGIDAETAALSLAEHVRAYGWFERVTVRQSLTDLMAGRVVWVVTGWGDDDSGLSEVASWGSFEGFDSWRRDRAGAVAEFARADSARYVPNVVFEFAWS